MGLAEASSAVERAFAVRRGSAFGLDVHSDFAVPALGDGAAARQLVCLTSTSRALTRATVSAEPAPLVELLHPDGRTFMRIDGLGDLGYRVEAPGHGTHLVAADGTTVRSAVPRHAPRRWHRLFFAQTLPLAATLQGVEPLHASAIEVAGHAVAFTASSGTGKSSVAVHAVAAGAAFVADDVVALELRDGTVVAHPAPGRAGVAQHELDAIAPAARSRLGRCSADGEKLLATPVPASVPLPLGLVYRLVRTDTTVPRVRDVEGSARLLLASCFLPYLKTPERLRNQLAVFGAVAESVPFLELELGSATTARDAAAVAVAHAQEILSS